MATTTIPAPAAAALQTQKKNPVLAQIQDAAKIDGAIQFVSKTDTPEKKYSFFRTAGEQLPAYKTIAETGVSIADCGCPAFDTRSALKRAVNGREYLINISHLRIPNPFYLDPGDGSRPPVKMSTKVSHAKAEAKKARKEASKALKIARKTEAKARKVEAEALVAKSMVASARDDAKAARSGLDSARDAKARASRWATCVENSAHEVRKDTSGFAEEARRVQRRANLCDHTLV